MRFWRFLVCGIAMVSVFAMADEAQQIHVDIGSISNAEDLHPVDGLTSAGQPNEAELALVAAAGYVAVIDLRGPGENRGLDEPAVVSELRMDYESLPLTGPDSINMENAAKLDAILSRYKGKGPVLVHCGSGNRVGAALALRESLHGAADEDAMAYGLSAGLTGLEPVVRSRLADSD